MVVWYHSNNHDTDFRIPLALYSNARACRLIIFACSLCLVFYSSVLGIMILTSWIIHHAGKNGSKTFMSLISSSHHHHFHDKCYVYDLSGKIIVSWTTTDASAGYFGWHFGFCIFFLLRWNYIQHIVASYPSNIQSKTYNEYQPQICTTCIFLISRAENVYRYASIVSYNYIFLLPIWMSEHEKRKCNHPRSSTAFMRYTGLCMRRCIYGNLLTDYGVTGCIIQNTMTKGITAVLLISHCALPCEAAFKSFRLICMMYCVICMYQN